MVLSFFPDGDAHKRFYCHTGQQGALPRDDLFFIIADGFPVAPGHLLIISNAVRKDYFELTDAEKVRLPVLIEVAKSLIH